MFLDQGPTDPLRRAAIWAGDKDNDDARGAGLSSHSNTSVVRLREALYDAGISPICALSTRFSFCRRIFNSMDLPISTSAMTR